MLSLHLVLVTLHGRFTINIEQDIELVTLNTISSVVLTKQAQEGTPEIIANSRRESSQESRYVLITFNTNWLHVTMQCIYGEFPYRLLTHHILD